MGLLTHFGKPNPKGQRDSFRPIGPPRFPLGQGAGRESRTTAGMQPRPELAGSREGSPRIEHESGSRLGVALLDALYGDFAAVELHGLARTCAFNGLEDRRHCRDAHKLLPMTVELAR